MQTYSNFPLLHHGPHLCYTDILANVWKNRLNCPLCLFSCCDNPILCNINMEKTNQSYNFLTHFYLLWKVAHQRECICILILIGCWRMMKWTTSRGVFIGGLALLSTYDPSLRLPSTSPIQALPLLKKKLTRKGFCCPPSWDVFTPSLRLSLSCRLSRSESKWFMYSLHWSLCVIPIRSAGPRACLRTLWVFIETADCLLEDTKHYSVGMQSPTSSQSIPYLQHSHMSDEYYPLK